MAPAAGQLAPPRDAVVSRPCRSYAMPCPSSVGECERGRAPRREKRRGGPLRHRTVLVADIGGLGGRARRMPAEARTRGVDELRPAVGCGGRRCVVQRGDPPWSAISAGRPAGLVSRRPQRGVSACRTHPRSEACARTRSWLMRRSDRRSCVKQRRRTTAGACAAVTRRSDRRGASLIARGDDSSGARRRWPGGLRRIAGGRAARRTTIEVESGRQRTTEVVLHPKFGGEAVVVTPMG